MYTVEEQEYKLKMLRDFLEEKDMIDKFRKWIKEKEDEDWVI